MQRSLCRWPETAGWFRWKILSDLLKIFQSLILSCLKQSFGFLARLTAGSDLCGCEAPRWRWSRHATPREALAYTLLTCPLLMLLCYKNVIMASWDSALSISSRWYEESKSHCQGVTFNRTTVPVSAWSAGCNGIDHWQWERSPHFDFFFFLAGAVVSLQTVTLTNASFFLWTL